MPTIICSETKPSTYDGGYTISDKKYGFSKKEFQTVYQIQADNEYQNEDDILATVGLPPLWLFMRNAYCTSVTAKEVNTQALLWEATAKFTSEINPENADNQDPESAAPQWTWGVEHEGKVQKRDSNDKIYRTTAGEAIAYEHPVVVPILTITRFQLVFDPITIIDYCNHVNLTTFWGVPPGSVLCSGIGDSQVSINDTNYRKVIYTFKVAVDPVNLTLANNGWQMELLNEGNMEIVDPDNESTPATKFGPPFQVRALDKPGGKPIRVNLDNDGKRITSTDETLLVWLPFEPYAKAEFNDLSLGPW